MMQRARYSSTGKGKWFSAITTPTQGCWRRSRELPSSLFLRKTKPFLVPEPGRRVRLRARRSPWRGSFRAVSQPYSDYESGEVVIRVDEENEFQTAISEGRRAVGMSWPARQIEVVPLLSEGSSEDA